MLGKALFAKVRGRWPSTVDCTVVNGVPWGVIKISDQIDSDLDAGDDWMSLASWCFSQLLHSRAVKAHALGSRMIQTRGVSFTDFDKQLRENLGDPSWRRERAAYRS